MNVLDTFAGIGGFTLGMEAIGCKTVAFCEIDPYAIKVLNKNWPEVPVYEDIQTLTAKRLATDGIRVDCITGGFPCQDISTAGKQAGIKGERSGLWGELARVIDEIQPRYAIMENVTALISGDSGRWFGRVLGDLAEIGYDAEWHCIPASAVGAHHHRDRVWIIAYPDSSIESIAINASKSQGVLSPEAKGTRASSCSSGLLHATDANSQRGCSGASLGEHAADAWKSRVCEREMLERMEIWDVEPNVGRVANGVPNRAHRLRCLGNAVVPQIPQLIVSQLINLEGKL